MNKNRVLVVVIFSLVLMNNIASSKTIVKRDSSGNFSAGLIREWRYEELITCDIKRSQIDVIRRLGPKSYVADLSSGDAIFAYYTTLKEYDVFFENKFGGRRYIKDGEKCFSLIKQWCEESTGK